jgi:hypothetical protein
MLDNYRFVVVDCDDVGLRKFVEDRHFKKAQQSYSYALVHYKEVSKEEAAALLAELALTIGYFTVQYFSENTDVPIIWVTPGNIKAPLGYVAEYKTMDENPEYRLMTGPTQGYVLGITDDDRITLDRPFSMFDNENVVNCHAMIDGSPLKLERMVDILKHQCDAEHGYAKIKEL